MKIKRYKYSLRNCNPPEKKTRMNINKLDFEKIFPFYSFDKNKIDLNLVRRFLYQNKIPYYYLYSENMMKQQRKDRKILSKKEKKFLSNELNNSDEIFNRFEILDL